MKRRFTILTAALALLTFLAVPMGMRGQTKITDYSNIVSGNTYYIGATTGGTDYYLYVYHDYNSTSTAGTAKTSMNDASTFVFEGSEASWTIKFDNGKYLSLKDTKDNGKVQVVADPATFTTSNQSGKIRLSKGNFSVQKNNSGTQFGSYQNTQTDIWLMEVPSGLALTTVTIDNSGITNTDVYTSTVAGSLSATVTENTNNTVISGATVTWSSSNVNVATVANDGSVTLVAEGTTTITAYYAGVNGEYGESSATYELNVSDSTPFTGGDVTFVAGTDLGTTSTTGPDSMTKQVVTVSSTSAAFATAEYRLYSGSETTISTSFGTITQIEFTKNGNYSLGNLSTETGNYTSTTGIWTGDAQEVTFNAAAQVRLDQINITITAPSSAVATTTTINVPANFNNDIYQGTTAGTLTATVSAEGAPISGATVTWSSSNTGVATIDANGEVTLVAVGTTTITASYAGVEDQYRPSEGTYELTVIDSNAPGTQNNPYTVAQARAAIDAGTGTQGVYATGIVSAIPTAWNSQYSNITFDFVDNAGDTDVLEAYRCVSGTGVDASTVAVGDIVVVYGNLTKYGSTYEFGQGCQLVALTHPTTPFVTVTPSMINAPFAGAEGTLALTYENIEDFISFDYYFCDADGEELAEGPDWINAEINENNDTYTLDYIIDANDGEARTAYIKVYTYDDDLEEVYAIVTVNQAHYVVDYAVLPFVWEGGPKADFLALNGVTAQGLGSDYAEGNAPYLIKLDNNGDYIQVKTNERPGKVTIDVKMIGGASTSTITIQGSADGETFNNIETLTISGAQNDVLTLETTNTFAANVRYVKMLFTKGSNVGVGPITITKVYTKHITGYGTGTGNWYLIASPFDDVAPTAVTNMIPDTPGNYDLYYFDQEGDNDGNEWINYKGDATHPNMGEFNLQQGKGYLYAHKTDVDLIFYGIPATESTYTIHLKKTDGVRFSGWNLVGNPYTDIAYFADNRDFYTMNSAATAFELIGAEDARHIEVAEGVFVTADVDDEEVVFTTTAPAKTGNRLALNLSQGNNVIDRAFIRFGECRQLPKLQFNQNSTKVYIPMDDKDYAVVRAEEIGEMPVNFKAESNGTYSLNFGMDNVEFAYLHLIDNLTGNDVDLLSTPSYSFEASTTDYESRFKLVFATGDNSNEDNFAYFSNGSFVINNEGNATLQVIDITGRIVKSESINGCANVNVNGAAGVYMLRLVNGDNVKVQKVVVK